MLVFEDLLETKAFIYPYEKLQMWAYVALPFSCTWVIYVVLESRRLKLCVETVDALAPKHRFGWVWLLILGTGGDFLEMRASLEERSIFLLPGLQLQPQVRSLGVCPGCRWRHSLLLVCQYHPGNHNTCWLSCSKEPGTRTSRRESSLRSSGELCPPKMLSPSKI